MSVSREVMEKLDFQTRLQGINYKPESPHNARLIWATPHSDELVAYIARVSNPGNQANENIEGLLRYMAREGHVSPFTMTNFCVEVNTSRAIGRQILRHWSLMPQEFSQRYASAEMLDGMIITECRLQDKTNRQSSFELPLNPTEEQRKLAATWEEAQKELATNVSDLYAWALKNGIAKESARNILPEGMQPTRMYFNGNIRSWIFYLKERLKLSTQKEHRLVSIDIAKAFREASPVVYSTFFADVDLDVIASNPVAE